MAFNHRFLLRLVTNLVVIALLLSCVGVLLWIVDEIIGWDILPDAISVYLRALIIGIGWVTFTLVIAHFLLSLALFAESSANRAELPDFQVSPRLRRRFRRGVFATGILSAFVIAGLQAVDIVRKNLAQQDMAVEAKQLFDRERGKFNQIQQDLDRSVPRILQLFTPQLLEAIATQKASPAELRKLFQAVNVSFPHKPSIALLTLADSPYKYARIDQKAIGFNSKTNSYFLTPEFYLGFPTPLETRLIERLFQGQPTTLDRSLKGVMIQNTTPSSWGVLRQNNRVIAVVYLWVEQACPEPNQYVKDRCTHPGPAAFHTNSGQ
jgi:hypothetical protein